MNCHLMKMQISKSNYLAIDFDGVIADSIEECYVVGFNAFVEYKGKGNKITDLSHSDPKDMAEFRQLRNFIRSGEDYVYIQLALLEKTSIQTQQDFDHFTTEKAHLKHTFFDLFYQEREWLSAQYPKMWIQLNPLYRGMKEFINRYANQARFAIISTKTQPFVHRILEGHGIAIPIQRIFQVECNRSKSDIIMDLLKRNGLEPAHFIFMDDQVETLIQLKHKGVDCYLAGWGYNNDTQKARARGIGIPVLTLDQFYQFVATFIMNKKSDQT